MAGQVGGGDKIEEFMKTTLLILPLLSYFFSCHKPIEKMNGHWYLKKSKVEFGDPEYSTLDIENSGIAIFDKDNWAGSGIFCLVNPEDNALDLVQECLVGSYSFEILGDSMSLSKVDSKVYYKGFRCSKGCCDRQKDFFCSSNLEIDLPIANDTAKLIRFENESREFQSRILIGWPINKKGCFPMPIMINLDGSFANIQDLDLWVETLKLTIVPNKRQRINTLLFVNRETDINQLNDLLEKLKTFKVIVPYVAFREKNFDNQLAIWLRRIDFKKTETEKLIAEHFANWPSTN